jgi:hypothetical protein
VSQEYLRAVSYSCLEGVSKAALDPQELATFVKDPEITAIPVRNDAGDWVGTLRMTDEIRAICLERLADTSSTA